MTGTTKDAMLARIRKAIANAPDAPDLPPLAQDIRVRDERDRTTILADFIDRLVDYKALVTTIDAATLPQALAAVCQQHNIQRLVIPADLPADLIPEGVTALRDDPPLSTSDLDSSDGVLTGCAIAIAQTGTIILDGGTMQGRRVLSLLPDRHLCIVHAEQVLGLVPEAIAHLSMHTTNTTNATPPITLISGPSATSDIELSRVEGVHGPRLLHVFVVGI
jgi:L-lactate dehydrogenase complex protein LldG